MRKPQTTSKDGDPTENRMESEGMEEAYCFLTMNLKEDMV